MATKQRPISALTDDEIDVVYFDWRHGELTTQAIADKHRIARRSLRDMAKDLDWGPCACIGTPGRKPLYDPGYDHIAYEACRLSGASRRELANILSIRESTIYRWMVEHESFGAAVRKGDDEFNCVEAERNLVKLVKGFSYNEVTKERLPVLEDYEEVDDATGQVLKKQRLVGYKLQPVKSVRKMIVPNEKAIMDFLCNRDPARWKSINKIEVSGPDGGPMEHSHSANAILAAAVGAVADKTPTLPNLHQEKVRE